MWLIEFLEKYIFVKEEEGEESDREFEYIVKIVVGEDNKRFTGGNEDE